VLESLVLEKLEMCWSRLEFFVGLCRWLFVVGDVLCWLVAVLEKIVKVGILLCWLGVVLESLVLEKLEMCWSKLEVFVGLCRWLFVVGNVLCWLVAVLEKKFKSRYYSILFIV